MSGPLTLPKLVIWPQSQKGWTSLLYTHCYFRASLSDCSSYSSMSKNNTETKNGMNRNAYGVPVLLHVQTVSE